MVGILSNLKEIENIQEAVWSKGCSIFYQWVGIHRFGYSQEEPETITLVPGEWLPSPNPPLVSGVSYCIQTNRLHPWCAQTIILSH